MQLQSRASVHLKNSISVSAMPFFNLNKWIQTFLLNMTRQIIMSLYYWYAKSTGLNLCADEWICVADLFLIVQQSPFESVRSQNSVWNLDFSQIYRKTTNLQMIHIENSQFWVVKVCLRVKIMLEIRDIKNYTMKSLHTPLVVFPACVKPQSL